MPALTPAVVFRLGVYLIVGIFLALGIRACPESRSSDPARDLLDADLARRLHANTLALDSARQALAASHAGVTRTVTRYQELRDTLNIHDTLQVIVFRDRADSVKRSCVELDNRCERLRVRADSSIAGLTLDRDRWKLATESLRPGRFDRVKEWGIRALIGYGAFRLGQSVH